jgi:hypothetical protein
MKISENRIEKMWRSLASRIVSGRDQQKADAAASWLKGWLDALKG